MDKVTIGIILVNVLFSIKGFGDIDFFNKYKFQTGPISKGEYVRLLTSGFLHVDFTHLLFNMFTLFIFADVILNNFNQTSFIIIYFSSLLLGNIYTYFYHFKNKYYSAVGASGAVSGVLFSAILLFPNMKLTFIFFPFVDIPAYIVGIGYLAYTVFGMKKQLGNIGHSTHLGGAVTGLVSSVLIYPELIHARTVTLLLLAIPIFILLLFGKKLGR